MNKLSLMIAASAMTIGAYALPTYLAFSTTGPDKYADGTGVQAGEVYALVWVKSGVEFQGITAKGELVNTDESQNKLVAAGGLAKIDDDGNGYCPTTYAMLDDEDAVLKNSGAFYLYLLDTRVTKTVQKADGSYATETTVSGINGDGSFDTLNSFTALGEAATGVAAATAEGAVASTVDESAIPAPVIKDIKPVGNSQVLITVTKTVPYIQYGLSAGKTPGELTEKIGGVNGAATEDGEINIFIEDTGDNRFFKVNRK